MPIDYNKYPPDWKTIIVPRILKRANDHCESCGIKNKSIAVSIPLKINDKGKYKIKRLWITNHSDVIRLKPLATGDVYPVKVILTIAHLDHDEQNLNVTDQRLKALCQYCHLNYDAKEKYRRASKSNDPQ